MDQMNVSITDHLAGFVRAKVASGSYNDASEVVREALRRMEDEEIQPAFLSSIETEDVLADMSEHQLSQLRLELLEAEAQIARGEYIDYEGEAGIEQLALDVIARGRKRRTQAQ